jgi:flagellar hook-associated protein 1 FlgK
LNIEGGGAALSDLGLSIAVSALIAQQDSLNVTSQNIANASTTGYSRESAELVTSPSIPVPSLDSSGTVGEFGTGVDVQTVTRTRDQFLDAQYRQQNTLLGESQQQSDALSQVETVFGDVSSTTGLNSDLDNFWQACDTLSQEPESLPERTSMVETATTLADDLQSTQGQLTTLQGDLNTDISNDVSHVNDDLQQIAGLNNTIQSATVAGLPPNDLLDQRDNLLDDLSTYVNAKTVTNSDNTVTLSIGGATVVDGSNATPLVTTTDSNGNYQVGVSSGNGQSDPLQWSTLGGALYGLEQARDVSVQGYQEQLNQWTATVAGAVNSLHETGYGLDGTTGIPFFVNGSDASNPEDSSNITAANITVNPNIVNDPQEIAAASGATQSTTTAEGVAPSAGNNGTAQVEALTVGGGAVNTAPVDLSVVVTAAALGVNSPQTLSVTVQPGDSAATIATNIAAALNGDSDVASSLTASINPANTSQVLLTAQTAAGNDNTMNVTVPNLAAATGLVAPGDGSNALGIFNLSSQSLSFPTEDGTGTISDTADDYYGSMISDLGVASSQASNDVTNQNALVTSLNSSRQSVSGVSLDEEMTNMVQEQSAYEAAAKLVNVIESMMQTVIGMVGGSGS